jgi:hypothetical protein
VRRRNEVMPSLLLASLSAVVLAHPATAALCATWDPPAPGVVGASASVSFRTSVPVATTGDDYVLGPHAFPDYPFRVRALSPDGAASKVSMSPDSVDDRVWRGSLTPDRQGRWTLIITNMQESDTACYTHAVLVVHGEAGDRTPTYVTVGVVMVLGGIAGFTLFRRRASATRRVSRTD